MSQGDIMVEPKRPMTVKWNTYKNGELRTRITKEIKQIASKKDYRRKLGLELGALREFARRERRFGRISKHFQAN